jgi:hypothetical protein
MLGCVNVCDDDVCDGDLRYQGYTGLKSQVTENSSKCFLLFEHPKTGLKDYTVNQAFL